MIELSVKDRCHNCPDFVPEVLKDIRYGKDPDPTVDMQVLCEHRGLCDRIEEHLKDEMRKETKDNVPGTTDTA